ncbi:MAG: hypothetical protein HGB19_08265 [Chlorobiales bacterium]|nr:hypothetical protein [Chlorobiales bacterium]
MVTPLTLRTALLTVIRLITIPHIMEAVILAVLTTEAPTLARIAVVAIVGVALIEL